MQRILNADTLTSHGNVAGRQALVKILETALQAADPYTNTLKAVRREGNRLIVGGSDFQPLGDPHPPEEVIDLAQVGRIYVLGAGKGIQRVAKALEEVLTERLTGGHVIDKKGCAPILSRIEVTLGAHPVPDEDCARGCRRILDLAQGLREEDLVFTVVGNGVSALLTLPVDGVSLEDVRRMTYLMQIDRGAPTQDLNAVRNHLDVMKGGRFARHIQPARAIHLVAVAPPSYEQLLWHNLWLHSLPDCTTFADAVARLKKWDAWEAVPGSIRDYLTRADPSQETVKGEEFARMRARIFGLMPDHLAMLATARRVAEELGFRAHLLASFLQAEASQAGLVIADLARHSEATGEPFAPPCALLSGGELLVTVGQEKGIGGRNQEYALAAALKLAGSERVVMGAVDSDGNDGPGTQFADVEAEFQVLAGGIVDGSTLARAQELGIDIHAELKRHNTSPALYKLRDGVVAAHNISVGDLAVTLILGRS